MVVVNPNATIDLIISFKIPHDVVWYKPTRYVPLCNTDFQTYRNIQSTFLFKRTSHHSITDLVL